MATIDDRATIDRIIRDKGRSYPEEPPVVKIVEYNNQWDGRVAWGVIWQGDYNPNKYEQSDACHNAHVIWTIEDGLTDA